MPLRSSVGMRNEKAITIIIAIDSLFENRRKWLDKSRGTLQETLD
jgi:hypothetical protein